MTQLPMFDALPPHNRADGHAKGYAAAPGSGPTGFTCGTCAHIRRRGETSIFKCWLRRREWTAGPGTDIRKGSPACMYWCPKPPDGCPPAEFAGPTSPDTAAPRPHGAPAAEGSGGPGIPPPMPGGSQS